MSRKNQVENQVDFNLKNFEKENSQNIVCNIYKEQFDLINELSENERLKVLYLAVLNAFQDYDKKNQINQVENQVDYTYISTSTSIYNSLSNYSKKLIKLLFKTINCKNYKNWGGKRKNSGRKKKEDEYVIGEQNIYGKYNNVCLTAEQYNRLLGICASQKLLDELVDNLSENIETGKEHPFRADFPNAHAVRLEKYREYRVKYPQKFIEGGNCAKKLETQKQEQVKKAAAKWLASREILEKA